MDTTATASSIGLPEAPAAPGVLVAFVAAGLLLAACSTTTHRKDDGASRTIAPLPAAPSASSSPLRKGGGYYLDDGPGDNPPANLELLPDAVPRIEKYASGANRPYNVFGVDYVPDLSGATYRQRGTGSWYGRKFHGQRTSSGEIYDMYAMTAAHPTLPIPCYALVTNLSNGKSVIVRVNDRGPFLHNRIMDLSYAAAYKVGYLSSGSGLIEVEMLQPADIAAGRIPTTTTGLLLAASGVPPASTVPSAPSSSSASSSLAGLTIEALTQREGPSLPPTPTIATESLSRSLPLDVPARVDVASTPDLVALPDRQPAAALPEITTGQGFYLQLGAFRVKAGADSFASHVARDIDPAVASKLQVSDVAGLYRVRVGPYARKTEADSAAASLRAALKTAS